MGGYIDFGADPVGIGVGGWRRCHTFLSAQYLVNSGWILTKCSWKYNWDVTKNYLDFGDLDLILKVTAVKN